MEGLLDVDTCAPVYGTSQHAEMRFDANIMAPSVHDLNATWSSAHVTWKVERRQMQQRAVGNAPRKQSCDTEPTIPRALNTP